MTHISTHTVVNCDPPTAPPNGDVLYCDTRLHSVAIYTCYNGYNPIGDVTRTCQEDGTWTGKEPVCEIVTCSELVPPNNGSVMYPNTTYGSVATYTCDNGFLLSVENTRRCKADGSWSGSIPTCIRTPNSKQHVERV